MTRSNTGLAARTTWNQNKISEFMQWLLAVNSCKLKQGIPSMFEYFNNSRIKSPPFSYRKNNSASSFMLNSGKSVFFACWSSIRLGKRSIISNEICINHTHMKFILGSSFFPISKKLSYFAALFLLWLMIAIYVTICICKGNDTSDVKISTNFISTNHIGTNNESSWKQLFSF